MSSTEHQLWQDYQAGRSIECRNKLVEFYGGLVASIVANTSLPETSVISADDHVANGTIGLINAIESFDLSRGVRFASYAGLRIRGEILDALRELDWVPRLERTREKAGKVTPRKQVQNALVSDGRSVTEHVHEDPRPDEADRRLAASDVWREAVSGMCKRDRLMVLLHFRDGKTMKEVGAELGVSESRVSQRISQLREQVRDNLSRPEPTRSPIQFSQRPRHQPRNEINGTIGMSIHNPDAIRCKIAALEQELVAWKAALKAIESRRKKASVRSRKER